MNRQIFPQIVVEPPGPKSQELYEKSHEFFIAPENRAYPGIVLKDGWGAMLRDMDDNIYLDFTQSVTPLGRAHPKHIERITSQLNKLIHQTLNAALNEAYLQFAAALKGIVPEGMGDVRFVNCATGSEACDIGINFTRKYTQRSIVLAYHDSYHGRTGGTLGVSTSLGGVRKKISPLLSEIAFLPFPNCYRCPLGHEYPSCHLFCLKYVETVLETEAPPENVAAIIMEPIQSYGGILTPPKEYFSGLQALCKKHGILLVLDEVYSAFGKTGKFFAIEHWLDDPDMICVGKGMGGGLPIAAVIANKEIFEGAAPFPSPTGSIGSAGGHSVGSAAATATIQLIKEEKLLENSTQMGKYLEQALKSLASDHEIIGIIHGKGLMRGIELIKDRESKEPANGKAKELSLAAFKKGLFVTTRGRYKQVVGLTPPLCITSEQIDTAIEILDSTLKIISV